MIIIFLAGKDGSSEVGWGFVWFVMVVLVVAGVGGYAVYKYRIRVRVLIYYLSLVFVSCFLIE